MAETTSAETGTGAAIRTFHIGAIGVCAARALREGVRGEVGAVFERSFYVVIDGQWVCLVPKGSGRGPLNAVCREDTLVGAIQGLRVGDDVAVAKHSLRIGPVLNFSFAMAAEWKPALPGAWDKDSVARGLALLNEATASRALPREGLASLLADPAPAQLNAVAKAAQEPMRNLLAFIRAAIAKNSDMPHVDALIPLLGLGPGLTPSGDDAIGGALIALHLLGEDRIRDSLWARLSPRAETATGSISLAHLAAAAEGFGHEAVHRIVNSVMAGSAESLAEELDAVHAIGHTSGWDALAGIVTALEAWLEAQNAH
jgi:hypothetical protein